MADVAERLGSIEGAASSGAARQERLCSQVGSLQEQMQAVQAGLHARASCDELARLRDELERRSAALASAEEIAAAVKEAAARGE